MTTDFDFSDDYLTDKRNDVRRSAILLDEENQGWEWRIDPDTLRTIWDACGCILHAIYGGYTSGLVALKCNDETEANYGKGFGFCCDKKSDAIVVGYWREEIESRRSAQVQLPARPLLANCVQMALAK